MISLPAFQTEHEAAPFKQPGWSIGQVQECYEKLPTGRIWERKELALSGTVPVLDQSLTGILGFHDGEPGIIATNQHPVTTFANHTCAMRFMSRPFSVIQNVFPLRGIKGKTDTRFLYFWLNGRVHIEEYKGHFPDLRRLWLPLPPLSEQRAIAGVLGALDDKIESNRRVLAIVATLTDATFSFWQSTVTEWALTSFGEYAEIFGGSTPSTSRTDFWDGEIAWATPSDITSLDSTYLFSTSRRITELGVGHSSTQIHPSGSIFMTSRATIGAFAINEIPCATNQGFIVVRPSAVADQWFLFHEMKRRVPEMTDRANGTTFLELSRSSFKEMSLRIPTKKSELDHLHFAVDSLHSRASRAASETRRLASLRDALLPELLSGRIRVRDAESIVEDAL